MAPADAAAHCRLIAESKQMAAIVPAVWHGPGA
jgi:hypothetical protein